MNDLIIPKQFDDVFPSMAEGLRRAYDIIKSIHSFEDVERMFLMGQGLSPNTYRAYLQSVKQFYDFTGGLNPLQVRLGDIEAFYDYLVKKVDRNTAYLRIRGLKKFFTGIRNVFPFYTSPFEIMSETLRRKLNRTRKGNRTKKGLEDYAIVLTLVTSGLRASELCQLRWDRLDYTEGCFTAYFIGKGSTDSEQELYPGAITAVQAYFEKQFGRSPGPGDFFFYSLESYKGRQLTPLTVATLWRRIRDIGQAARREGIIKRNLQFSPHLFRRTYASLLYKNGMRLKAIQEKTRHSSIEVLARHYVDDTEPASPIFAKILRR